MHFHASSMYHVPNSSADCRIVKEGCRSLDGPLERFDDPDRPQPGASASSWPTVRCMLVSFDLRLLSHVAETIGISAMLSMSDKDAVRLRESLVVPSLCEDGIADEMDAGNAKIQMPKLSIASPRCLQVFPRHTRHPKDRCIHPVSWHFLSSIDRGGEVVAVSLCQDGRSGPAHLPSWKNVLASSTVQPAQGKL